MRRIASVQKRNFKISFIFYLSISNLVGIRYSSTAEFIQRMSIGGPLIVLRKCQICDVMHLYGVWKVDFRHYCRPRDHMSHVTTNKMAIRPVWSESSLSAWRKLGSLATHLAHSEDSDQTVRMPRLIWVFVGRIAILLVLSCRGSIIRSVYWTKWVRYASTCDPDRRFSKYVD